MDIGNIIISAVNTVVDNKKQSFDRTIQAIVKDNSDPNKIGEIKISYKDAILPVYTDIKEVKNYPKGSHIYVTIPNNDMSARKTVLGLVEKIGPLTVLDDLDSYSLESKFVADDSLLFYDSWANTSKEYIQGWSYKRNNADEWTIYDRVTQNPVIGAPLSLINFFKTLKTFAISSDNLKFSSDITALLLPFQKNISNSDYGIELDFYLKKIDEEDYAFNNIEAAQESLAPIKARLNIDQLSGDPYLQSNQTQSIIIDTSRLDSEYRLNKINFFYYRRNFPAPKQEDILPPSVKISNFTIEAINQIQKEETSELALYITTPKGKMFLPKMGNVQNVQGAASDSLTLNAVIKEEGVQLDNSNLTCYWYEKDLSYTNFRSSVIDWESLPENCESIYDLAGAGWRIVSLDSDNVPVSTNPLTVARDDLYGLVDKEYKAVGFYNNVLLSSTVVVKNLDNKNSFSIDVKTKTENNIKTYTYTLLKAHEESNIEVDIRWYYTPDGGAARLLRTIESDEEGKQYSGFSSDNRNSISLREDTFKYSGQIICEVYRYVNKTKRIYTTLTEVFNANVASNVLFYNFEQVFLYDTKGKITLVGDTENENKYSVSYRPVSISGDVTNVEWRIPMDYFERPENVTGIDKINRFYIMKNVLSLSNIKLKTTYPSYKNFDNCPLQENIVVDFTYIDKRYRKTTNFTFVKEGMNGTNGSGVFCRIVPNIDRDNLLTEPNPNTVVLAVTPQKLNSSVDLPIKAVFNFLPLGMNKAEAAQMMASGNDSKIQLFKVQLWQKNQKIFEDYKIQNSSNTIQQVAWSLFPETKKSFSISKGTCHITATEAITTRDQYSYFRKWLARPQGISATVKYLNNTYNYSLPFVVVGSTPELASITFDRLCSWRFFNPYDSFSLSSYANFYYNEDGLRDSSLSFTNSAGEFTHYKDYPLMYAVDAANPTRANEITPTLFTIVDEASTLSNFSLTTLQGETDARKVLVYASQYFSDFDSENSILYKQGTQNFYYQIPLRQKLNLVNDAFVTTWNGKEAIIDESSGIIITQYLAAGKKNIDNTFSGAIVGVKGDKTGLLLYSQGNKSMYLSADGKIEIGQNPAQKIVEDGNTRTVSNGLDEGLSIDLSTGILKYKYANNAIDVENESKPNIAIQINKKNRITFKLSENGTLQTKEIVGVDGRDTPWGIYDGGNIVSKDNNKQYFINENGVTGLKQLYVDTTVGRSGNSISGLVLKKKEIKCNLQGFCKDRTSIANTLTQSGESYGFSLDSNGFCIGASNNGYSAILSSGYCYASNGFIPSSDSDKKYSSEGVWKFNASGLEGPNSTIVINKNGITAPILKTGAIVADDIRTTGAGAINAQGVIHTNSDLQGNTVYSANQVQATSYFCITNGDGFAEGIDATIIIDNKTLVFRGGILISVSEES